MPKPRRRYAQDTTVPVGRTQQAIKDMLKRIEATRTLFGDDTESGRIVVGFTAHGGRQVRIEMAVTPGDAQEERAAWRRLLLLVTSRVTEMQEEMVDFDSAFMPFLVLSDGRTFDQLARPAIEAHYATGREVHDDGLFAVDVAVRWVKWALEVDLLESRPGTRVTLIALATFADKNGHCFPSQRTLAKRAGGVSVRTIQRHLEELENENVIVRERRHRKDGSRSSDRFWLAAYTDAEGKIFSWVDQVEIGEDGKPVRKNAAA